MSKIEVGSYVKLVALVQQSTESESDLESLTAICGRYVGEDGEVIGSFEDYVIARFSSGEEFIVYLNEVELVEEHTPEPCPCVPEPKQDWDKGTRVKLKVQEPYVQEYLADGLEGVVTSSHTNGMIYVQMDAMPSVGSWAFAESELQVV